ncbi:MAG: family 1 glycosylhydrolase [Lachnospiraceae bacterium]|nr:family 1 glycosylhydrolase [Lachnospiraceae bacterium]
MKEFKLKKEMLIGTASAATQIEGGVLDSSWMDWAKRGYITDGTSPARANDHYRLWEEDARLMGELKMQICRLGVEWARIEPVQGNFCEEALAHYRREIEFIQAQGIKVLVTLHHFTNPMWFEQRGAFEKKKNITFFIRFVEKVVLAFDSLVNEYITINEPNVYAVNGYYFGSWPPGKKKLSGTLKVMSNLSKAHLLAYRKIHVLRIQMGLSDTMVSFANHLRVFVPENPDKLSDRFSARLMEYLFQGRLSKLMIYGRLRGWGKLHAKTKGAIPKYFCDFHALNYYTRGTVTNFQDGVKKDSLKNDLGWEIYPSGIVECAKKLYDLLPLPIYVTENGTCDNDDSFRSLYLYEHLKALSESNLPIERYYHWCFCDNFEWVEGESARFGIVHIDYETQKRTIKKSGEFLRAVVLNSGVDTEIYEQFIEGERYRRK